MPAQGKARSRVCLFMQYFNLKNLVINKTLDLIAIAPESVKFASPMPYPEVSLVRLCGDCCEIFPLVKKYPTTHPH
ncbi:hypothetical protein NDI37_25165 [Funiculus sociatus GB2-A5]|uniref:Uncharacterized protein n=2 Tax=Funiculus TaxID=2886342 RepID=A0ABV0JWA5_9CYAN|nr:MULTISPECIES: hypothetical protein [unclassified Trichocoleus]MBD1905512.1 hypothetical protein [Trichocoleus sp. FACHB-832]MBD2065043.1 hypothetical protein [Trichocoleus sp. FACHB-6]